MQNDKSSGYPEAREFIRALDERIIREAVKEYWERLDAKNWTGDLAEYREPKDRVFVEPGEYGVIWGRRLLAIAFRNEKGKPIEHKRLGGMDGILEEKLRTLGFEVFPWGDREKKKERQQQDRQYREGKRASGEHRYFVRHYEVAKKAKERDGWTCQCCKLRGPDRFDLYGERCIEAHHLKAFGDRSSDQTDENRPVALEDVVALCANCHRVVHSRRPALTVAEAQALLRISARNIAGNNSD
jgi:hypothetical protein